MKKSTLLLLVCLLFTSFVFAQRSAMNIRFTSTFHNINIVKAWDKNEIIDKKTGKEFLDSLMSQLTIEQKADFAITYKAALQFIQSSPPEGIEFVRDDKVPDARFEESFANPNPRQGKKNNNQVLVDASILITIYEGFAFKNGQSSKTQTKKNKKE